MPTEERQLHTTLRQVYGSLLMNGPFTIIVARTGEMMGLGDRIRLRPLVAAGLETGVLYVPGEFAHVPDEAGLIPRNECRLCFGVAPPAEIDEGIRRLRLAVDRASSHRQRDARTAALR